ncbi:DgyrCDS2227 [Dimorphilus gyrociliatus]|uniref:Small ribosomal subunit protein mS26 n=1 Tax=Dimorphilus gyrociliatus TaxID=2664684 RepID=A0A7I8VBG3_9ANNE|nr:DgyrCDS2227 [Dimorphilus gyrociliatus]
MSLQSVFSRFLPNLRVIRQNGINAQQLRFRKRRWAPIAASKLYVVPPDPHFPEWDQLRKLEKVYATEMRSIRQAFVKERQQIKYAQTEAAEVVQKRKDEFQALKKLNNEWNDRVGKIRQERQILEDEAAEERRIRELIALEEEEKRIRMENERLVREEIENSKQFIDMDDIDNEIEKALNSRADYNFAIDVFGNRYYNSSQTSSETSSIQDTQKGS